MTAVTRRTILICTFAFVGAVPYAAQAGLPWFKQNPERGSEEWWAEQATRPPGTRQIYAKGKHWPPYPRPTGAPQHFVHKYHTAHYWPYPYVCQDRAYVQELIYQQVHQGWLAANTLYDYHFDEKSHQLNKTGELQLRRILLHHPSEYQMAYVQASTSTSIDHTRLESARLKAQQIIGAAAPPIDLRVATIPGRPAVEVEQIRQAELGSLLAPRIRSPFNAGGGMATSSLGGGGGSGSGSGGNSGSR